jgi:hypothetical protein
MPRRNKKVAVEMATPTAIPTCTSPTVRLSSPPLLVGGASTSMALLDTAVTSAVARLDAPRALAALLRLSV